MGGEVGHTLINVVEAYDPATDTWSTKAPLPMAMNSVYAVVDGGIVFTIGGYNDASVRVPAVEIYNPATDQWTEGAPLNVGKSLAAVGVFGAEIIAAGGLTQSGDATADNEGQRAGSQSWTTLAPVPTARQGGCFEAVEGTLFLAGGNGSTFGPPLAVVEAYTRETNSWTTGLASMPYAAVVAASASVAGCLYCFGGSDNANPYQGNIYNYVQIYQP